MERVATWWTAPMRSRHAYAVAAGLGLLAYMIVYGPGHLLGTSSYWDLPQEDSRAYLIGYRYFLHEPWHWPVFVTHTMNVPYPKSIAFSDSIPIFALINKAIATVIPPWGDYTNRGYLGLWHAISYMLQPCLGVAILRQLGERSRGAAIVSALFLLAIPSWIFRYGHAALSAHWLILSAFYLYLRTPVRAPVPRRVHYMWIAQLGVAALVNPYHVAFSTSFYLAALLDSRQWRSLAWFPVGVGTAGLALWFGGYFSHEATLNMGGFDVASMNMLSMFVPERSGIVGNASWLANVNPTQYQYEGLAYLGLGVLILIALFLPRIRSLGPTIKRRPFLFALALGAWFFALSNRVYFGSHLVLAYRFPSKLHWIEEQFRSPGRFAWIPMYVLVLFLVRFALQRFKTGWQLAIVPILAVVQLADASGEWKYKRSYTHSEFPHVLPLQPWKQLVHAHDAVFLFPTYDCILGLPVPNLDHASLEIQYAASERGLPINGVYTARPTRDCVKDEASWASVELRDHTLYVVFDRAARLVPRLQALGATCGHFVFGEACSTDTTAIAEALRSGALTPPTPPVTPALAYRQEIAFAQDSPYLSEGWSFVEPQGRWSDGPTASLLFHLTGDPPPAATLKVNAAAPLCGKRAAEDVDVFLDDEPLVTLHFDASSNDVSQVRSIPIAHPELLRRPLLVLDFRPRDTRSPAQLGCNADKRALGILIQRLWFE